ncbi:TPA: hypothetical protein DDW35_00145 [Candidatus Sumerlaeota bacterium]|nr:hypothetical protein [Candidatus Sumerlaeota bacterium]
MVPACAWHSKILGFWCNAADLPDRNLRHAGLHCRTDFPCALADRPTFPLALPPGCPSVWLLAFRHDALVDHFQSHGLQGGKILMKTHGTLLLFLMGIVALFAAPSFAQTSTTLRSKPARLTSSTLTTRPTSGTLRTRPTSTTLSVRPTTTTLRTRSVPNIRPTSTTLGVRPTTTTLRTRPVPNFGVTSPTLSVTSSTPASVLSEQEMDKIELSTSTLSGKISHFKEDANLLNEWLKQPGAAGKITDRDLRLTQAKLDLVDRNLSRLQLAVDSRRHETRALAIAEARRSDLTPPEIFHPTMHIDDRATSSLLGQAFQASLLQEQFAQENIRTLELAHTNLELDVARLTQFNHYAQLKPEELAVEEKRIEDEAATLEKEILKVDGSVTSSSQVANALAQSVKLSAEDRATQLVQEKKPSATQPLLSQIRQSLSKKPEPKTVATPGKKSKLKMEPLPVREVSLSTLKKQIHAMTLPAGTSIYAIRGGQVLYAGDFRGLGKAVVIAHDKDICTIYGCLSGTDVVTNGVVQQGQKIGTAGTFSGQTRTGVQFEVRKAGEVTDLSVIGIKLTELEAVLTGKK